MSGLEQLRRDLGRPDLTEAEAERLFDNRECVPSQRQAARMRYQEGLTTIDIAEAQECTRGPVIRRLKVWRERAIAMLESKGESE